MGGRRYRIAAQSVWDSTSGRSVARQAVLGPADPPPKACGRPRRRAPATQARAERGVPRLLTHCPACGRYASPTDGVCECGHDFVEADAARAKDLRAARRALVRLRVLTGPAPSRPPGA
jgi:hypothetical protein